MYRWILSRIIDLNGLFFRSRTAPSCFSSPMNVLGRSGTFRTPPWFPWVQVDYCTWMKRRWRAMFWVVSFWIDYWLVGLMIIDVYIYILIVELTLEHISMSIAKNDLPRHPPILRYDVLRQVFEWSSNLKSVVHRRIPLIAGELSSQPGGAVLVVWRSLSAIQDCWARTHRRQQDTGAESEKYWQHGKVWDENTQPVTSDRMMIVNIDKWIHGYERMISFPTEGTII